MKHISFKVYKKILCFTFVVALLVSRNLSAQCGSTTPNFTANLIGSPSGTWTSPSSTRGDLCCTTASNCIKFTVFLDPKAMGLSFDILSGAVPGGALFYQVNCGPAQALGAPICLSGPGPHIITFCKPGNNANVYGITSIPAPVVPDSVFVRNGCTSTLITSGFSAPTITWTSVSPGAPGAYNSYLNCTSGCSSVIVTPSGTPPPLVKYVVRGAVTSSCQSSIYSDTATVYFYSNLLVSINPGNPTICAGSNSIVLTASVSGGLAPYTYTWSNVSYNQSLNVGAGNYSVIVSDKTGCPPATATSAVSQFTLPITAKAGPDRLLCKSSPTVTLSGTIAIASGGMWSGGTGTFTPSAASLTTGYIPSASEVSAGSVELYLTSTGNSGCTPGKDTLIIAFQSPPLPNAGPDHTVCANNAVVGLSVTITNFSANPLWFSSGTGTFNSTTSLATTYTPSIADITTTTLNIIVTTTNNGVCPAARDTAKIFITPQPIVNAGADQIICSLNHAALNGTVTGGANAGVWSTLGDGSFSPGGSVLTTSYIPGLSDIATGSVSIVLTSSNNGNCVPVTDTLKITIQKTDIVNAGLNQEICSSQHTISLAGSVSGGTTTGIWSVNGVGPFNPGVVALNTTYSLTPADVASGSLIFTLTSVNTGPCPTVNDSVKITIRQLATVNAGVNESICSSQNTIALNGLITGTAGTGNWTADGAGTFNPGASNLVTAYSLTASDITNGFVTFTLTSTNTGVCGAVADTVKIKITEIATVNAGLNQALCSSQNTIALSGTVAGSAGSGSWTVNGTGAFSPGNTSLATSYSLTSTDITNGSVIFTLSSTNNGPCALVSDSVKITIRELATVNAGANQSICSSQNTIALNGLITGTAGTGNWTADGAGIFNPGASNLVTAYSLTASDITNGFVTFTLTSTNNGVCGAVADTVKIKITEIATVNAGLNQALCSSQNTIALSGTVGGSAGSGSWTVNGTGAFSPGNTNLITSYSLTSTDITNGSVTFTLSSTNNGPCAVVNDSVKITVRELATVSAGLNQSICSSQNTIALNGIITATPGSVSWTSSGTGIFSPGSTVLNTSYSITPLDITNGFVTFTLSSTNTGVCATATDTVKIRITQLASVNAGFNQSICSSQNTIALSGFVTGGSGTALWASGGSGSFNPGPSNLITSYSLTPTDISSGSVTFTLSSTNNGVCTAVSDTVKMKITESATVYAGVNQALCSSQNTIALNGTLAGSAGSAIWTVNGTGGFSPGSTSLITSYSLTQADIMNGSVIFTLSSTNNGPCAVANDTVKITIRQLASVNAGLNQSICSSQNTVALTGNITGLVGTGLWTSGGGGSYFPGSSSLSTSYSLTPSDVSNGFLTFTLTSTNNGVCPSVSDTVKMKITEIAIVNAGPNQSICSAQNTIALNGSLTGAGGTGIWTTDGTGSFAPNSANLATTYSLTGLNMANGFITFTLTSTNNGVCASVSDTVKIKITQPAVINAGLNQALCSSQGTISLNGVVTGAAGSGLWSSNGTGGFSPNNSALITSYSITPADITNGFVNFTLSSTNNGPCAAVSDSVKITIRELATVNAGLNQSICSSQNTIALNGVITGMAGTGIWTADGAGTFNPGASNLATAYSLTPSDIASGFVTFTLTSTNNGVCAIVADTVKIKITEIATVNAGLNQTLCSSQNTIALNGTVGGNSPTGAWTVNGTGAFSPGNTNLITSYSLTSTDITNGSVIFTLSSTNNGPCAAVSDSVKITIRELATVNAGPNQSICSSQNTIALTGVVTGATGSALWTSSGGGSFPPGSSSLNTSYSLTSSDIITGFVTFTLTSTNNGVCSAVADTVRMRITEMATVNAGANQALCSSRNSIALIGSVTGASSSGSWTSTGTGVFFPGATNLSTSYSLTSADVATGFVTFTLSSTNNGVCTTVADTVKIKITELATVNAGANQVLCSSQTTISLNGIVTGSSGTGVWTVNGSGGFSPHSSSLTTSYSLTPTDIVNGSVIFTLSSTNNGPCPVVNDSIKVIIQQLPTVNAGLNQSLCSSQGTLALSGSITGHAVTGAWVANGTGSFSPSASNLNTSYAITPTDISAGFVTFTLISGNNGVCAAVSDTVKMKITEIATVNAGLNQALCSSQTTIALNGIINSNSGTGAWAVNGAGAFAPGNTSLFTSYSLTPLDITNGSVTFTLSSANNGPCAVVSDSVKITIRQQAAVNAGSNQNMCSSQNTIALSGVVTGIAGSGIWTSSGPGTFSPGSTNLITSYSITPSDITNGSVTFSLTSTNNGVCSAVSDTVKIKIQQLATVNAGSNQYVCSSQNTVALSGVVTGSTVTGSWSASGSGVFLLNSNSLNTSYSLTPADVTNGFVIFTLTSGNNGVCAAVNDTVKIKIRQLASVNAGLNQALCASQPTINLNGLITGNPASGAWTSNGAGVFSPGSSSLTVSYSITPGDVTNGSVIFTLSSTNNGPCAVVSDSVKIIVRQLATVNAGSNQALCSNVTTVSLNGTVSGGSSSGTWNASGPGNFIPGSNTLSSSYSLTAVDKTTGFVIFTLTSTNNSPCPAVNDTVKISIRQIATVNAGANQTVCSTTTSLALNGIISGSGFGALWSSNGTGLFSPANSNLNTSYGITASDSNNGTVVFTLSSTNNGPCPVVNDTVNISIRQIAAVNAGSNQLLCSSQGSIYLSGMVGGSTSSGTWSANGAGNFSPGNTSLISSYSMTPADISNGFVTFTLASTNNGVCPVVKDTVKIKITKLAQVNAGLNQSLCSTSSLVILTGNVSGASGTGTWNSDGNGTFTTGVSLLNTSYLISPSDVLAGSVIFTLTSTGNGPCPAIQDTLKVGIHTLASVNSGINQSVCSSQNSLSLNGAVTGGSGMGQWVSSGSGNFTPNTTSLNTIYTLSPLDIINGFVTFTLSSTNNGACAAVKDTVKMKITKPAIVNAGLNQSICSTQNSITLSGSVNGAGNSGLWSSSGSGGFAPTATHLATGYSMTAADITTGFVTFTLSSTNNGPCALMEDTLKVIIKTPAQVNAGSSQTICSNANSIALAGNVNGASLSGIWNASGTGSFAPGHSLLLTHYVPTLSDITNGVVSFTLTSTGNGGCPAASDVMIAYIQKIAKVNAGADKIICSSQQSVVLNGSITGAITTGSWSTTGTGSFLPDISALNSNYSFSAGDINQGNVYLLLSSTNNGVCPQITDSLNVTLVKNIQVNLGSDTVICEKQNPFSINIKPGNSVSLQWLSSGSGSFSPNKFSLPVHYYITPADVKSGSVLLTVTSLSNGPCANFSSSIKVKINRSAKANFSSSAYTVSLPGDPVIFTNQSILADSYLWNFSESDTSSLLNPIHRFTKAGYYTVNLIANNEFGCSDTAEKIITVIRDVQFPNAFTPNPENSSGGTYSTVDYSNDVFFPYTEGVVDYELTIFNRWGEQIFRSADIQVGWDGYFNGKLCQQDVYVWKVNLKFFDGRTYNKIGSVTLLR